MLQSVSSAECITPGSIPDPSIQKKGNSELESPPTFDQFHNKEQVFAAEKNVQIL